jgi:signal transduction histidine kinase
LLTREIVLEHKGDLHVEKSGLGGASFVIDLPQKSDAEPSVSEP